MRTVIGDYRELHNVKTTADYRRRHAAAIARIAKTGARVAVHVSQTAPQARVEYGNWIIDCECGAGNAADPNSGLALCFACGAVHEDVVIPDNRAEIEALLLQRPQNWQRGWVPGEPVENLIAENENLPASRGELLTRTR